MRRGSALLMALWTIMVLGVIVMSFAFEAKQQGGVNLYVQGRNRVKRLLESGKIIGEAIVLDYKNAKEPQLKGGEPDWKEIFEEEDRWCKEKYELKTASKCTIGPILLDENPEDPQDMSAGTVTVEIEMTKGDSDGGGVNINRLYSEGDQNFVVRWQMILDMCGVPRDNSFRDSEGKSMNLQYHVISCWQDYRDEDDTRYDIHDTDGDGEGAEKKEYEEYYDDHKEDFAEEDRFEPANGEIADIKELSRVLCFQEYPAILTGGALNPWADKDDQIVISRGLVNMNVLGTGGTEKLNANNCTADELMTIPGIYDEDEVDMDEKTDSREIAEAIVACRKVMPQDYDVDESRDWWPYKDWQDMCKRVADEFDVEVGQDASKYLTYQPEDSTVFKMKITARLLDMEYSAECECYVKDKEVRYTSWKEN